MELIHGTTLKASKFAPEDIISNMPDIITTNILDRLPIQDAVRTSILARNWRFKWTLLSQLVFDTDFYDLLKAQGEDNYFRAISTILLRLKGAVTKFDLTIDDLLDYEYINNEDFNSLILLLLRKGVKDLTIENAHAIQFELPTHLFSCLELKHLKLRNFDFNPPPTFHGFPNLLSLDLCVEFKKKFDLEEFFTRCPLVENLAMDSLFEWDKVKLDGIAKLENLKILSLKFYDDDDEAIISSSTIFKLLGSLSKLEELQLDFEDSRLIEGGANKRLSTVFPSLEVLKLTRICLDNAVKFSCAFELIRSCPNLLYLEITTQNSDADPPPQIDYNTTWPLELRRVLFECSKGSENELRLIEFLLANSPYLDKIEICFRSVLTSDEKLKFTLKLLKFQRESPAAEIELF